MSRDATTAFARTLVDEWVRQGLTDACVAPGSRSAPLALALAADGRIRLHVHLDERSASFFALGLERATGRAAVLLCTSGTAAANSSGRSVIARPTRMPPALPPLMPSLAGVVHPSAIRYSAQAAKSFQVFGLVASLPARCHSSPNAPPPRT